jgi:2,5-diketo-D-gluconate reductase A
MHPFYQQSKLRAFHKKNGIQTLAWSPLFKKEHDILLHPALVGIAARYSASVAQIILVWHKLVGSVPVVKTRSIKHMRENFEAMKIILLKEDLQKISLLDADMKRGGDPSTYEE